MPAPYACINKGGNHPQAANKETVNAEVSAGGSFAPKNGRVVASLSAGPPSAGAFSCPSGQRLVLAGVSYTNTQLCDTTNNVLHPQSPTPRGRSSRSWEGKSGRKQTPESGEIFKRRG
jgi:hypothetical protein